jgi:predicted transcriptional regulator
MSAPTEVSPGVFAIKKMRDEEFCHTEYAAIAAALNLEVDQVAWSISDTETDGIDQHSLVGQAAS